MSEKPDFDQHGLGYSAKLNKTLSFVGQGVDFFTKIKADRLLELAKTHLGPPERLTALDVGCGVGLTDTCLAGSFGKLHGIDVSGVSVQSARTANAKVEYSVYDGEKLPYVDDTFDLVFAICVMHHVPPPSWDRFMDEMKRVTVPGGLCVVFEHNPINPVSRYIVHQCEFDRDAVLLWPSTLKRLFRSARFELSEVKFTTFFPWSSPLLARTERLIGRVPLGGQYFVAGKKPR